MFEIDSVGRVARITLQRPGARNAIPIDQWAALADAVDRVGSSDARVLILRSGAKEAFCAGADIGDLTALQRDRAERVRFRETMATAIEALARLPIATIAAVDGGCYGAGVALILACDIRIAGDKAAFAITPAKIGIVYPAGDVARLKALVGNGQAARLLYSGMTIAGADALSIGLVEQLVGSADDAALTLAGEIARNAPSSIRGLKRILGGAADADAIFDDAFDGDDFVEGARAFRERRRPEFGA